MKILDRIVIVFLTLGFIILAVGTSVLPFAKSNRYYMHQYEVCNTVERTGFSEDELRDITQRMIDYLYGKRDDMQYYLERTHEDVFSDQAITHMEDVKLLFTGGRLIVLFTSVLFVGLLTYLVLRFNHMKKKILKYSLLTVGGIIVILGIFFAYVTVDYFKGGYSSYFEVAFINFHKIIFPDPEKCNLAISFSPDDNLIRILNEQFFMNFGITIGVTFTSFIVLGFSTVFFLHYRGAWIKDKLNHLVKKHANS